MQLAKRGETDALIRILGIRFYPDIATLEAVTRASEDRRRAFIKKEKQFMIDLRNKARQG